MDNFKYVFNTSSNNSNNSQTIHSSSQYHHVIYQHNSFSKEHILNKIQIEYRSSIAIGAVW